VIQNFSREIEIFRERAELDDYMKTAAHLFALLLGIVSLIIGIFMFVQTYRIYTNGIKAVAIIKSFKITTSSKGMTHKHPVLIFQSADGAAIEFTADSPMLFNKYKVGDNVEIIYNSANPEEAQINTFYDLWLFPVAIMVVGLGLIPIIWRELKKMRANYLKLWTGRPNNRLAREPVDPELLELERLDAQDKARRKNKSLKK